MAYVTYAEAATIYATMLPAKMYKYVEGEYTYVDIFTECTEAEATRYLEAATTWINQQDYIGTVSDSATGTNVFPRNDDTEVPYAVKEACVAIACLYAKQEFSRLHQDAEMVMEQDGNIVNNSISVGDSSRSTTYRSKEEPKSVAGPYLMKWFKKQNKIVSYTNYKPSIWG